MIREPAADRSHYFAEAYRTASHTAMTKLTPRQVRARQALWRGSEIHFLPVAERMIFIRGFAAAPKPEQQQQLITGISQRMQAFGQHCGTAGNPRCYKFADRDGYVCSGRRINLTGFLGHSYSGCNGIANRRKQPGRSAPDSFPRDDVRLWLESAW